MFHTALVTFDEVFMEKANAKYLKHAVRFTFSSVYVCIHADFIYANLYFLTNCIPKPIGIWFMYALGLQM